MVWWRDLSAVSFGGHFINSIIIQPHSSQFPRSRAPERVVRVNGDRCAGRHHGGTPMQIFIHSNCFGILSVSAHPPAPHPLQHAYQILCAYIHMYACARCKLSGLLGATLHHSFMDLCRSALFACVNAVKMLAHPRKCVH